jgi:hypothetical protein
MFEMGELDESGYVPSMRRVYERKHSSVTKTTAWEQSEHRRTW